MPIYFTLTRKGEDNPAKFADIDDQLCAYMGVEPDEEKFFASWFDMEGFALALGKNWDWMRSEWPERIEIIDWLDEHYTSNNWGSR